MSLQVLQTFWLREKAGSMAYYDKERFATQDAVRVGRIHTFMPGLLSLLLPHPNHRSCGLDVCSW